MKKTEETRQCTKLQNYIRALQAQLSPHFFLSHPELFLFLPFSFLFNLILLMLVYLVYPGCVRHRVKMEEHTFKSQTLWIKSALLDHQRAPGIVQINTLHFFPYSFRLMCTRIIAFCLCCLIQVSSSGTCASQISLFVLNSALCATQDTKLVMQGGYYLVVME